MDGGVFCELHAALLRWALRKYHPCFIKGWRGYQGKLLVKGHAFTIQLEKQKGYISSWYSCKSIYDQAPADFDSLQCELTASLGGGGKLPRFYHKDLLWPW